MDWKEQRDMSTRDGTGILAFLVKALAFEKMITYQFNAAPCLKDFCMLVRHEKKVLMLNF